MNNAGENDKSCLCGVLQRLSNVLVHCETEVEALEIGLSEWVLAQEDARDFPIMQLQRLDYLRQVQRDLSVVAQNISKCLLDGGLDQGNVDKQEILKNLQLMEVKQRISGDAISAAFTGDGAGAPLGHECDLVFFGGE